MKTSVLLAVSAFLAPSLGSPITGDSQTNQFNQYGDLNSCNNRNDPIYQQSPQPGRCYDMQDGSQAFYWQYGSQYRPLMYYGRGCTGGWDPAPINQCWDRGQYQSYMIVAVQTNALNGENDE